METEMDAENGNCHGIKLAHVHKNSHELEVVTVVRKPGSNPRANACETPFLLHVYTRDDMTNADKAKMKVNFWLR